MPTETPTKTPGVGRQQPQGDRFFAWMRSIDLTRQPGWIGGVAAGIGQRLNIDPIIVRGIIVVVGLLGAPVLLLYAVAWMLLPDHTGKIHAEELFRGRFEPPVAGAGLMVLLELLPSANFALPIIGPFFPWWSVDGDLGGVLRVFWTLAVIGSAIWLVVWLVRRSNVATTAPSAPIVVPATTDADPATVPVDQPTADAEAGAHAPTATFSEQPPTDAAELAAWKDQQAKFKQERDEYVRADEDAQRAAMAARVAEQKREREARAAAYRAERERTRSNPLYTLIAIGVALVAGAAVMMVTADGVLTSTAVIGGLATTLGVLGIAIIVNGVLGKRSGGASGLAWVVAFALVATSAMSIGARVVFAGNPEFAPQFSQDSSVTYLVGAGQPVIDLSDYWDGARQPTGQAEELQYGSVNLLLGAGDTTVILPADTAANLDLRSGAGSTKLNDPDGGSESGWQGLHQLLPPGTTVDEVTRHIDVTITVGAGDITVITEGELQ